MCSELWHTEVRVHFVLCEVNNDLFDGLSLESVEFCVDDVTERRVNFSRETSRVHHTVKHVDEDVTRSFHKGDGC